MPEIKTFKCANKDCHFRTYQTFDKIAQEIDNYRLCKDCVNRGFRIRPGMTIYRISRKEK
jgi:hypothetical protein